MPLSGSFPITDTKKYQNRIDDIEGRCDAIKREIGNGAVFWVYASNKDFDGNQMSGGKYYLYIGY